MTELPPNCHDCGAGIGALHDRFCSVERCPFCSGQLSSCECIYTVLELSDAECDIVGDYEDDSVDPLKSIVSRWVSALDDAGRVPYGNAAS